MEEKMAAMTPEEREKFREQCYGYAGWRNWEGNRPEQTNPGESI
jgi:hypothetical protein